MSPLRTPETPVGVTGVSGKEAGSLCRGSSSLSPVGDLIGVKAESAQPLHCDADSVSP